MWNITAVKPLYNSDDPNDTNNYRGISLLPCLGKLFCLVINEIVMHNLESAGLSESVLSLFQGGFRRRRGCREQSLVLLASILSSKRRKKHAMCAFIDFSKAYDTVQHEKLWATLSAANMGPKILNILKELYRKTSCTVKSEEGQFSEFYEYLVGVRQGCVLSPAIFNLFINSLANLIKEHEELLSGINIGDLVIFVLLYADDVVLLAPSRQELQKLLTLLQSFCEDSGMRVNLKKSKVVIFKGPPTKNTVPATALKFYESVVEEVPFYKYLGVLYDEKLTFQQHVEYALLKARKASFALFKYLNSFKNMSIVLKIRLYKTLVLSVLLYNVEIWGPQLTKSRMAQLEAFHRSNLKRIIMVNKKFPNDAVYFISGEMTIESIVRGRVLKFLLKL
ncbi:unnamed protein product, partial [Heterosigma akashiwo]